MKTTAFGVSALGIVMVVFIALLQIVNTDTREESLRANLYNAMTQSLWTVVDSKAYTIDDDEEFVADVIQGVILELGDPKAELEVEVYEVNRTLGIISMKVTAKYPSVTSGTAAGGTTVSVKRTVFLEQQEARPGVDTFSVKFENPDGSAYKTYVLKKGAPFPLYLEYDAFDAETEQFIAWKHLEGGRTGTYWNDDQGRENFSQLQVDKNYTFQAVVDPK